MKWYYQKKELKDTDIPEWAVGFVYRIVQYDSPSAAQYNYTREDYVKIYIGKKLLKSTRKSAVGKRAIKKQLQEATDKRRIKRVQVKVKDSGWRNYTGSCKPLNEAIKEHPELYRKVILEWAHSKKHLSYLEVKHQIQHNVLETDSWNDNIAGKYYRKDMINPENKPKNINGIAAYIDGNIHEVRIDPVTDKMTIKK